MVRDTADGSSRTDRRTLRTRKALHAAILELVLAKDLGDITVADVAERADVSRPTFYGHYRDTGELAADATSSMVEELVRTLPALGSVAASEEATALAPRSLEQFFDNFYRHQSLYRSLLGPNGSAFVWNDLCSKISSAITAATVGAGKNGSTACSGTETSATFTAGALVAVAADWVGHRCPTSSADMAAALWPVLAAVHSVHR